MATRSEEFRANEQRKSGKGHVRPGRTKPGVPPKKRSRAKKHAAKKATYALEPSAEGKRPSRKSTRKSANRAKPDASFNAVDELRKGSPESRFRRERARTARARGSTGA